MRRVVVVGAGISGLSAAHALAKDERVEVTVLERSARLGGNIVTEHDRGFTLDGGPDSWVVTKPQATELAREVGLGDRLIPTIEETRRVYVAWNGALHPLPEGLVLAVPTEIMPIVKTPLFSWDAKLRMGLEPLIPPRAWEGDEDESIGDFVARRLGDEVADRLAGPMLGGIFAGDARALSIRVAFPQFVDAEKKYGSIIKAMRAMRAARAAHARERERAGASGQGDGEAKRSPSAFLSLRGGMHELVDAVVAHTPRARMRTGAEVRALERSDRGGWRVVTADDAIDADDVILTAPLHASSAIVRPFDPELAAALGAFEYASTATVFFAFERAQIAHALDGVGFLVPKTAGREMLAATWVTSKWPGRAPEGYVLLRVFFGGAGREAVLRNDDAALAELAMREMRTLVRIDGAPLFTRVFRFVRASPQPTVGHLGRVRAAKERLARWPGLHVATNGFEGIGIPDCVRQGQAAAAAVKRA